MSKKEAVTIDALKAFFESHFAGGLVYDFRGNVYFVDSSKRFADAVSLIKKFAEDNGGLVEVDLNEHEED